MFGTFFFLRKIRSSLDGLLQLLKPVISLFDFTFKDKQSVR